MASVTRRRSGGNWSACWRDTAGKLFVKTTKTTDRSAALAMACEFERAAKLAGRGELVESNAREILAGILERGGSGETIRTDTFESFSAGWLKSKSALRASATHERYAQAVREFSDFIGQKAQRQIKAITAADVEGFIAKRRAAGLSSSTCAGDLKILRSLFNSARRHGLIATNPAEAVETPEVKSTVKEVFTPAEIDLILDAAPNDEWRTLILLGAFAGCRLGDAMAMSWSNVDLNAETIGYEQEKTGRAVTVPIHPKLMVHLLSLAGSDGPGDGPLSPTMAGKSVGGRHGMSQSFLGILRRAGVDERRQQGTGVRKIAARSFHSLRHSFASNLANAGVPDEVRMAMTGHSSRNIHAKYTHLSTETLRAAVGKLGAGAEATKSNAAE